MCIRDRVHTAGGYNLYCYYYEDCCHLILILLNVHVPTHPRSLAAKRRVEELHVVFFSNQEPEPSTITFCCCCVYSSAIPSHERRALGALLSLVSGSEPRSTDSKLQSGCGEARRLRSRIVVVFVVQRIDCY